MRNSISLTMAAILAGLLVAAPAGAADRTTVAPSESATKPLMKPGPDLTLSVKVGCVVRGTPVEFPDDIFLSNDGTATIPAGFKVEWEVAAPPTSGIHTFAAAVAPGTGVFVQGALPGGVPAGVACTATPVK